MIILLIAFGSVLAMGLPIGTALFGIGTGIAIVLSVRNVVDMPDFTTAAVAMVGLGVGIDYALFIVTRYRENLAAGLDPERSVVHARRHRRARGAVRRHHGVISVLGLLLMKTSIMRGVAIAHLDRRAHHDAGVGHAAAGAARLRRAQHRQVRAPATASARGRRSASRAGTGGAT